MMMVMFHDTSYAKQSVDLCSSSCGDIDNITSPFRLTSDLSSCGDVRYNLSCENNLTLVIRLPVESIDAGKGHVMSKKGFPEYQIYYVKAINYNNYTIRLVDPNITKNNNSSSIPKNTFYEGQLYSLPGTNPPYETVIRSGLLYSFSYKVFGDIRFKSTQQLLETVVFLNCENPVLNSYYIDAATSFSNMSFRSRMKYYSYYLVLDNNIGGLNSSQLEEHCWIEQVASMRKEKIDVKKTSDDIHAALVDGFELSWLQSFCKSSFGTCYVDDEEPSRVSCISRCVFLDYGEYKGGCGKHY